MDIITLYTLLPYTLGSVVGYVLAKRTTVESLIDRLIEDGFLRHRQNDNGDVVIIKWNDNSQSSTK